MTNGNINASRLEAVSGKRMLLLTVVMLSALIAFLLLAVKAHAEEAVHVQSDTTIVANLGMLQGDENGLTAAYLGKTTTRIQAAIMYLRLKGLENEALTFKGMDNFSDAAAVGDSNKAIMAYLKAHSDLGWTGMGDGTFDPLGVITAQQYYKVMLEALGFKQGTDFTYDGVFAFAATHGLTRVAAHTTFRNSDIATATVEALQAATKSGGTLADALIAAGIVDAAKAEALKFPRIDYRTDAAGNAFLADGKGMALYFYTKDPADPNSCQGQCLVNWPIFYAEHLQVPAGLDDSAFGVLTRKDGTKQTTYRGWPLYYFIGDKAPGDVKGEAVGNVWYLFKPYSVTFATYAPLGNFLVDGSGKTLYYFDKDTKGTSACSGQCLANWPVFYSESVVVPTGVNAADFGTLVRSDGTLQTTYRGFPLYYFAKDTKAGATNGQGVNNVWFVVDPAKFTGTTAVNTSVKLAHSDKLGNYLADANGMALYYYTKDSANVSVCSGKCLANWPAFYAEKLDLPAGLNAADFGTITREDGAKQTTFRGYPLYYWVKDTMSGQTSGQDVGKVWYVVDPATFQAPAATPGATPPPASEPKPAEAKAYTVYMENFAFSEPVLTVEVGAKVTFTNKDDMEHNAVAVDGSFATPLLKQGESATITLDKAGEYDYFCEPHKPFMKAKIVVK